MHYKNNVVKILTDKPKKAERKKDKMKRETKKQIKKVLGCKRYYTKEQHKAESKKAIDWANYYFNDFMPF